MPSNALGTNVAWTDAPNTWAPLEAMGLRALHHLRNYRAEKGLRGHQLINRPVLARRLHRRIRQGRTRSVREVWPSGTAYDTRP